jgi:hypothetical protein
MCGLCEVEGEMNAGRELPSVPAPIPVLREESVWTRRETWGSIAIGAIVGFAITVIGATFGAAAGLAVGASDPAVVPATVHEERAAARNAAQAGAIALILTAVAAGIAGGMVAGRISMARRNDVALLALATWAVGLVILIALAAFGVSGPLGGWTAGAGAGELISQQAPDAGPSRTALIAAAYGVWGFLLAQLIGLGATLIGARTGMNRRLRLFPAAP